VVLLRGVNVGGNRTFRPTELVKRLKHLDVVNIGAAGTFVVREQITATALKAEFAAKLPFETRMMICTGKEILRVVAADPFAGQKLLPDMVRFLSVLAKEPPELPALPISMPPSGKWLLRIVGRDKRYAFGIYRRDMKVVGYLGQLDKLYGVPATTRNWNTVLQIAKVLGNGD
jgi:uncharacterized protein (DUF1697 family)